MTSRTTPLDASALRADAGVAWHRLDVVEETGSTNADLLSRAGAGTDIDWTVLVAEHQTAGRGRHGRHWVAPPRSQIALSVGVDATDVPPSAWGWLPLATGVAVADVLAEVVSLDAGLKWPNDVVVGDGKLAGILAEVAAPQPVIVVGVGLNVTMTPDQAPDPAATSLTMLGKEVDRTELAAALLRALAARIAAWRTARGADPGLTTDYQRYSRTLGTRVRADLPDGRSLEGAATGIDDLGRLCIDTGTETVALSAGDITHLRASG